VDHVALHPAWLAVGGLLGAVVSFAVRRIVQRLDALERRIRTLERWTNSR
jgi:hypothetical protein